MKNVGKNIKKLRNTLGLSLREMQKETGLAFSTICKYESDAILPTMANLKKIIDMAKRRNINITYEYFME